MSDRFGEPGRGASIMHCARHLVKLFDFQVDRFGARPALRGKRHGMWVDVSWQEWGERVHAAALGLLLLGLKRGERVAILSENRLEWVIADLAILSAGGVTVPLHAPLSAKQVREMLADSGAVAVIVSNEGQAAKVASVTEAGWADRAIIVMDEGRGPERAQDPSYKVTWQGLEQLGRTATSQQRRELAARHDALGPEDLASLLYTSGTTGASKGVMLTHGNFLSNVSAMDEAVGPFAPDAIFFNWLPLSHVYARTVDYYLAIAVGATLVLGESAETVAANLLDIRPMHLSSVPRFYEKLMGSFGQLEPAQWRQRLRAIFGPRIRWLGCGGAALPAAIAEAFRAAGLEVVVGYGLTESSPVIATNALGANKLGSVGRAIPGIEVKIAPDGEILTRGPHVMKGYWNQPEATAAAIRDGWLHTGDLGQIDEDGYLTITGRKKDLIVLSNGKKVAPTAIEGLLLSSPLIEQAAVFGDGRSYLAAVIVPRDDAVHREMDQRGSSADMAAVLMEQVDNALKDVAPWEKVRKIVVAPRAFSVAGEELTASMKMRRTVIHEHYRAELDEVFDHEG